MATTRWRGGFRYLDLNPNGWAAVLVPGAVAGLAAARLWHVAPVLPMIGGIALSWLLALVVDRWSGGRTRVALDVSDLPEPSVDAVVARLDTEGVPVTLRRLSDADADPDGDPDADPDGDGAPPPTARVIAIRVANRHRSQAEAALAAERRHRAGGNTA